MGVYKFSQAGTFVQPRTLYKSMLAGNEAFVPPGDYELIASEILTGTEASVTFSNLGDYSSTYKHLQIRVAARSTRSGESDDPLDVRFNSLTSSFFTHRLTGNGSSVASEGLTSRSGMRLGFIPAANSTANSFGGAVIDVLDAYSTTKNKTFRSLSGMTSANFISLHSGSHATTSSITEIKLLPQFGSFVSGSRFSLYGIRG